MSASRKITILGTASGWEVRLPGDAETASALIAAIPAVLREWDWSDHVWRVMDTYSIEQFIRGARREGLLVIVEQGDATPDGGYLPPSVAGMS